MLFCKILFRAKKLVSILLIFALITKASKKVNPIVALNLKILAFNNLTPSFKYIPYIYYPI